MSEARSFVDEPARRQKVPLLVGVTGPSSSGKTFSALRLATGMQRVIGGDIFVIDTEARRALHYAENFRFRHVDFKAPFRPLDYLAAIEHCVGRGAGVLVVDSMTHEHNGMGGVMDQSEKFLDERAGDDEQKRRKLFMLSLKEPKRQRMILNTRIVQLGVNAVFCYRAHEKVKPKAGDGIEQLGWQPETTSPLFYEMTTRFLLEPAADGKPNLNPETPAERLAIKNPEQFRGWFTTGIQLTEDLGQRMAEWASGSAKGGAAPPATTDVCRPEEELVAAGDAIADEGIVKLRSWWESTLTESERKLLRARLEGWKRQAAEVAA